MAAVYPGHPRPRLRMKKTWMSGSADKVCAVCARQTAMAGHDVEGAEMDELTGKVAIVTGAGRNIGRAIALALAEGGAFIVVNARANRAEAEAAAREIETLGVKTLVHIGDVADPKAVQAMVDAAVTQFGRLDILVNNAALRRGKPFAEMSYAQWREVLDVTLHGALHLPKALPSPLPQRG